MSFPRIMYHSTQGSKTDYGWGWRRVESIHEHEMLLTQGWVDDVADLNRVPEIQALETEPIIPPIPSITFIDAVPSEPVLPAVETAGNDADDSLKDKKKLGRKPKKAA